MSGTERWIGNSVAVDGTFIQRLCDGEFSVLYAESMSVFNPEIKMGNKPQLTVEVYLNNIFVPDGAKQLFERYGTRFERRSLLVDKVSSD